MNRFYVGQEVVCIKGEDNPDYPLKEGNTYTIQGIRIGCCKQVVMDVGVTIPPKYHIFCAGCKKVDGRPGEQGWFNEFRFAPVNAIPAGFVEVTFEQVGKQTPITAS